MSSDLIHACLFWVLAEGPAANLQKIFLWWYHRYKRVRPTFQAPAKLHFVSPLLASCWSKQVIWLILKSWCNRDIYLLHQGGSGKKDNYLWTIILKVDFFFFRYLFPFYILEPPERRSLINVFWGKFLKIVVLGYWG